MRDYIKKQLEKCQIADLSHFDQQSFTYKIPRYSKPKFDVGKCYLVKLPPDIINNNSSVLASNWNNGFSPRTDYLKVYVSKVLGKMIYVDGIEFNVNTRSDGQMWSGWLDSSTLSQLEVL